MGRIKLPQKVLLISAFCYNNEADVNNSLTEMIELYGPVKSRIKPFAFTHTQYYCDEMGENLFKFYCTFEQHIEPMEIVDIKLQTNDIEEKYSKEGKRNVNIDPGYIEVPKLVLATTKNYGHRIYLGKGIYGDVQLYWSRGTFQANPWTYPDYTEPQNFDFFVNARKEYFKFIQKGVN
ncbi:DUF4416 family protein [candidate division KSB1 bacterium]|nr:DUF4416 family protein [candidate division KSB1 bacterium]